MFIHSDIRVSRYLWGCVTVIRNVRNGRICVTLFDRIALVFKRSVCPSCFVIRPVGIHRVAPEWRYILRTGCGGVKQPSFCYK